MIRAALLLTLGLAAAVPALAQERGETREPRRWRVGLGPQLVPSWPGSKDVSLRPLIDVSPTRGDTPFAFEAPDESTGFPLLRSGGVSVGPSLNFEGTRTRDETDGRLPRVGFSVELGGFAQVQLSDAIRLRGELRKGVSGHKGVVASVGGDYVARDADRWLFSLGPRVTITDGRYQRAYFGIGAEDVGTAGLPAYRPSGGVQAIGATAGALRALSGPWGLYGYARYDRLVGDAADSPVVRAFGSRNQLSGGIALTYTFSRGR